MPKAKKVSSKRAHEDVKKLWHINPLDMTKEGIKKSFASSLQYGRAKDRYTATSRDNFMALGMALRDRLVERWIKTQQRYHRQKTKRVYYLYFEFLIGGLLGSY
ncbi:MAG TPA: hypothetical protein PK590_06360, partial [Candidatus Omnitrophota bacterium]|nr:hypothetical protein [Candidatus Omnitrophota bacterium]